jgi:hypothetical protein
MVMGAAARPRKENMNASAASQLQPSAARDEPGSRKFGCVLFDDEKNPGAAWVAVNGGEARRIDGTNQLPTDALYWTNISYESFFMSTEAFRNPWLKHDAYLTLKPKDVLVEWGMDPSTTAADYAAKFLSTMFGRVMGIAYRLAKECDSKVRMSTLFGGKTLRDDLRSLLPKVEFPKGEARNIMKQGQAYSLFTRTGVRGVRGGRNVMLRKPRIPYTLEMLSTPVPKGPFEFRSRAHLRTISPDRVAWVRGTDQPCMVEVTVDSMQGDVAPVYGFGNSTDKDRRIPRSWVAHPEFLVMSSFSELSVSNAYVGREYDQLNLALPEPVKRFLSDKHVETSWSAGIVAETLWRSVTLGEPKERGSLPGEDRAGTSWQGAWVMAADKTSGFLSAMKLTDLGYAVTSYGYGWIYCQVTEDQVSDLMRDGLSIGLVPRLMDVPNDLVGPEGNFQWGGDKKSKILATLTSQREKQLLWNLDKLPLYDKDQREQTLRKILEAWKRKDLPSGRA